MNRWTDEGLGALLTETFRSREPLADPDVARRLAVAAGGRHRSWLAPAAAAAAVVLVAGVAVAVTAGGGDHRAGPATPSPSISATLSAAPVGDSYAAHRAAARAEAARLLTLVPLPTGAEQLDGQPPGGSLGQEGLGPSDPDLTQTAWWTVPNTPTEVGSHFDTRVPDGFTLPDHLYSGTSIDGSQSLTYVQTASTEPLAYHPAYLLVRWKGLNGGTVVRADVFIAAYDVRDPASVLTDVTAVGLSRTVGPAASLLDLTQADDGQLARIVASFQGLPASMKPPMVASCPAPIPGHEVTDTITFHESGGSTLVAQLKPGCWGQVTVTRDGVPITPTLDPGDLDKTVQAVFAAQGG